MPTELLRRLQEATHQAMRADPSLSVNTVLVRGVELAILELEEAHGPAPVSLHPIRIKPGRRPNKEKVDG